MAYLFFKDGRMQVPPCNKCGSSMTDEVQEIVQHHAIRKIYIQCMQCGHKELLGTYKHLGGHDFKKI
jgi:DNA-directed RNA polymerase subunit RPC12/RpoP